MSSAVTAKSRFWLFQAELEYSGWLGKLLIDLVKGRENYDELFKKLASTNGSIKMFREVQRLTGRQRQRYLISTLIISLPT